MTTALSNTPIHTETVDRSKRKALWYFGGIASAGSCCVTHPLDLLKVTLQTQQSKMSVMTFSINLIKTQGVMSLYSGISASLMRQLTYSMARFGLYDVGKDYINTDTLMGKVTLAGISGTIGGFIGTPADMVNVRMQNDVKLTPAERRNYKHAFDGLLRVYKEEGFVKLYNGGVTATSRGLLMTVGQIAFYDQFKSMLLETPYFEDNITTYFASSLLAGGVATTLTQPIDVIKTRSMNAKPGEFNGLWDIVKFTARAGPLGFFKGYIPAFIRLAPQTILTFIFLEQLRLNFGDL